MGTLTTTPAPEQLLESKALTIPEQAASMQVTDQATINRVNDFIGDSIDPLMNEANSVFDPIIAAAYKAHKAALAGKAKITVPLETVKALLKRRLAQFDADQKAIAEKERRRLQEIADREALEQREREIEDAEAQGAPAEIINAIAEAPLPPAAVAAPAPTYTLPRNLTPRETWTAEVHDHMALLKAIVARQQPAAYCPADMTTLNAIAKSLKGTMNIPGVRAVKTDTMTRRST